MRSSAGSTTGAGWCRQRRATIASSTAAECPGAERARVAPAPVGPSTMPPTSAAIPAASRTAPMPSGRAAFGSRASRSTRAPTRKAPMPTGTLTRKTQRQLSWTSRPPIGGPAAAATALTAAQPATATDRWCGLNSGSSSASEVGSISAAPIACTTRVATSASTDQARRTGGARDGEEREPGEEDALAPVGVGPAAGGDEQRGEDDRVRVEDPAEAAEAGAGELRPGVPGTRCSR